MEINAFVFGGTFDPMHEGHLEVVRGLRAEDRLLIIAPTEQNPFKERVPTPRELRLKMVERMLKAEGISLLGEPAPTGVYVSDFEYVRAVEFISNWRSRFSGELHWVVADDIVDEVETWKDWSSLDVKVHRVPITISVHATDVRAGKIPPHPAIRQLIRHHGLYPDARWDES